jgi:hypothetical protein
MPNEGLGHRQPQVLMGSNRQGEALMGKINSNPPPL